MNKFMKMLNNFIGFITGLCAVICMIFGVYYANKSIPDYGQSCYYLLLTIINYLTCINFSKND